MKELSQVPLAKVLLIQSIFPMKIINMKDNLQSEKNQYVLWEVKAGNIVVVVT